MKGIRRVVTGIDQDGQDIFTSDGPAPFTKVSETLGGWAVDIWEMASIPPGLSDDGALTTGGGFPKSAVWSFGWSSCHRSPPFGRTRRRPATTWELP